MEKALKKGVSFKKPSAGQFLGQAGSHIKGPITLKELRILTDATAKSKAKYGSYGANPTFKGKRPVKPIYMKFRIGRVTKSHVMARNEILKRWISIIIGAHFFVRFKSINYTDIKGNGVRRPPPSPLPPTKIVLF